MRRHALLILVPTIVYLAAANVQSQVAEESAPKIGVSPLTAADPAIDDQRVHENTNPAFTTAGTALGRQSPQSRTDPRHSHFGDCPASNCFAGIMTQSTDPVTDGGNQIACGIDGTTPNAWARCFDLSENDLTEDVSIDSVTFGVQQASIDGIQVNVNLYLDGDGCPASGFGDAAVVFASESTVVGPADEGNLITLQLPIGTVAPAGSALIVEIEAPADGTEEPLHSFCSMSNDAGQCRANYIRAATCGVVDWVDMAAIGFPDAHLVMSVGMSCLPGCDDCPTDVNDDGDTGPIDLATLLGAWGPCNADDPCECLDADSNGVIDPLDLATLLASWGPCL